MELFRRMEQLSVKEIQNLAFNKSKYRICHEKLYRKINFSPDVSSSSSSSENDLSSAGRKQKLQNYIQKLRNRNKQLFSNNDYAAPPVTRPPVTRPPVVVRTTARTTTTMEPVRRQYMDYGDRIVFISRPSRVRTDAVRVR